MGEAVRQNADTVEGMLHCVQTSATWQDSKLSQYVQEMITDESAGIEKSNKFIQVVAVIISYLCQRGYVFLLGICLPVHQQLNIKITDRIFIKNFTKELSLDQEVAGKFYKSSTYVKKCKCKKRID